MGLPDAGHHELCCGIGIIEISATVQFICTGLAKIHVHAAKATSFR